MNYSGLLGEIAGLAAEEAVKLVQMGELSDIGAVEDYIGAAMQNFLEKQGPALSAKLATYLEPVTAKAVDVVKPAVMEALKTYTPTFAAVVGTMIALSILGGNWFARREFRRARG